MCKTRFSVKKTKNMILVRREKKQHRKEFAKSERVLLGMEMI